jgi:hypothetical protein
MKARTRELFTGTLVKTMMDSVRSLARTASLKKKIPLRMANLKRVMGVSRQEYWAFQVSQPLRVYEDVNSHPSCPLSPVGEKHVMFDVTDKPGKYQELDPTKWLIRMSDK